MNYLLLCRGMDSNIESNWIVGRMYSWTVIALYVIVLFYLQQYLRGTSKIYQDVLQQYSASIIVLNIWGGCRMAKLRKYKISVSSSEVHLWCLLAGNHGGLSSKNVDFGEMHTFTPFLLCFYFSHTADLLKNENDGSLRWLVDLAESDQSMLTLWGCSIYKMSIWCSLVRFITTPLTLST